MNAVRSLVLGFCCLVFSAVALGTEFPVKYLAYIESDGSQYIDTAIVPSSNMKIEARYQLLSLDADYNYVFGSKGASDGRCQFSAGVNSFAGFGRQKNEAITGYGDLNWHTVVMDKGAFSIDGTGVFTGSAYGAFKKFYLFALNDNGTLTDAASIRISGVSIYKNDVLSYCLVPCEMDDGRIGFWDFVNLQFYGDTAGGNFIGGPEGGSFERLEYVKFESAAVDAGIIPTDCETTIRFRDEKSAAGGFLFGHNLGTKYCYTFWSDANSWIWGYNTGKSTRSGGTYSANVDHVVVYNDRENGSVVMDGEDLGKAVDVTPTANLQLGLWSGTRNYEGRIYWVKVTNRDTGNVGKWLVPVKAGTTVGFYEPATGTVIAKNGAAGALSAGPLLAGQFEVACQRGYKVDGLTPLCGLYENVAVGDRITMTAPTEAVQLTPQTKGQVTGWKLYEWSDEAMDWVYNAGREGASGTGTTCTYVHTGVATKFEWQVKVYYLVKVSSVNATTDRPAQQWVTEGDEFAVTAAADSGFELVGWRGEGVTAENRHNAALSVTVQGPTSLSASASPTGFATGNVIHVADFGSDENDGLTWAKAKQDPVAAVAGAAAGDGVILADCAFAIANTMTLDRGVKVRGVSRDLTVITGTNICARAFLLSDDDAEVCELTINGVTLNKNASGDFSGLGFNITKGFVHDCRIVGNSAYGVYSSNHGVGVYMTGGHISRMVIEDCVNSPYTKGGGLYMTGGTADNLLIRNCTCAQNGGGVYASGGTLAYATVYGCTSPSKGGGIYIESTRTAHPYVYNCISYGNVASSDTSVGSPNWYEADKTLEKARILSFAAPAALGTNPVTSGFDFADAEHGDLTLRPSSSCINAGTNLVVIAPDVGTTDLNGTARPWGENPDIGCYEFAPSGVQVGLSVEPEVALQGETFVFTPYVYGADPATLTYKWTATGVYGETFSSTDATFSKKVDGVDYYTLTLEVSRGGETLATYTRENYLHVGALTNYVSKTGSATPPYATPATAATSVQDAIDEAIDGAVILIAPGTYEREGQLEVEKGLRVLGTGATFADVVFKQTRTTADDRVLYIAHPNAVVSNMTLTGGCFTKGYYPTGAGVRIEIPGGTVTHCRIIGNTESASYGRGAGVCMVSANGVVSHCVISNNSTTSSSDSTFGGGVYATGGLIDTCLICNNTSFGNGGGLALEGAVTVRHCTVAKNYANKNGGGIQLRAAGATVIDTVFDLNEAPNDSTTGKPEWHNTSTHKATFTKCMWPAGVTTNGQYGANSYSDTPVWESADSGDFHPTSASPTKDKGDVYDGMSATDLDGNPRVSGKAPDIGCYEFDQSALSCSLAFAPKVLFVGDMVTLTPSVSGVEEGTPIDYAWTVDDGLGHRHAFTGENPRFTLDAAGLYRVTVTATVEAATLTYTSPDTLRFAARTNYLTSASSSSAAFPYDTPATAHTNLHELVNETIEGSVIVADEGVHLLDDAQVELSLGQRLCGAGMDRTFFKSRTENRTARFFFLNHEDSRIEGVTTEGARPTQSQVAGISVRIGPQGGTFAKSRITGCTGKGSYQHGVIYVESEKGLVDSCYVHDNTVSGGYTYSPGICMDKGVVRNCLVANNRGGCYVFNIGAGGIVLWNSAQAINCTVVSNYNTSTTAGCAGGIFVNTATAKVRNCLLCGNGTDSSDADKADWNVTGSVKNPNFENCYFSVNPAGTKPQTGDVRFKPTDLQPFGLDVWSPCRNAGVFSADDWPANPTDLSGQKRVRGSKIDIGCYECFGPGAMLFVR